MIELLKYLANNLEPEQLLEVAHIVSKNPDMINKETFMHIVNAVEGFELREIDKSQYDHMKKHFKRIDKAEEIYRNSAIYKLLTDNNISLN
jgi:hypothetical protein